MKDEIIHDSLIDKLDSILVDMHKAGIDKLPIYHRNAASNMNVYATSQEYLKEMLYENYGPPLMMKAASLHSWTEKTPEWQSVTDNITDVLSRELGEGAESALVAYYPAKGYIGWHDNSDEPGYTVLFSWSAAGDGYYRYLDLKSNTIITMRDEPGWTCKSGYYGVGNQSTMHCASTEEPRWSIAFYIKKYDDYINVLNKINGGSSLYKQIIIK